MRTIGSSPLLLVTAAVLATSLVPLLPLAAQTPPAEVDGAARVSLASIPVGDRLRITRTVEGLPLEGMLAEVPGEWLTLELDDGTLERTPMEEVAWAELHSRERDFWENFLKVELLGTLGAALAAAVTFEPVECSFVCFGPNSRGEAALWGAAAGAVVSLPIAVAMGALVKEDRWTPVSLEEGGSSGVPPIRVRIAPTSSDVFLGASISLGGAS